MATQVRPAGSVAKGRSTAGRRVWVTSPNPDTMGVSRRDAATFAPAATADSLVAFTSSQVNARSAMPSPWSSRNFQTPRPEVMTSCTSPWRSSTELLSTSTQSATCVKPIAETK